MPAMPPKSPRDERQDQIVDWAIRNFGPDTMRATERAFRFFEEATELFQSLGMTKDNAHHMVDYVFARPAGEPRQEIGGVGTTLLALAQSVGVSADMAEHVELQRVLRKSVEHFRARHAAKVEQGIASAVAV